MATSCSASRPEHGVGERFAAQVARRDVDRDVEADAGAPPPRDLGDRVFEHPVGERVDETGRLGDLEELGREQQAPRRVLPAQQRLDAVHAVGTQVELRLVVQHELVGADGVAELAHEREPLRTEVREVGRVLEHRLVRLLRRVHREVGALEEIVDLGAVGRPEGDADAGLGADRHARHVDVGRERALHAVEHDPRARRDRRPAARGRTRRRRAGRACRRAGAPRSIARGDVAQVDVAVVVPERVVHFLEAVEVDDRDPNRLTRAARRRDRVRDAVAEERAVRQTGEHGRASARCSLAAAPRRSRRVTDQLIAAERHPQRDQSQRDHDLHRAVRGGERRD